MTETMTGAESALMVALATTRKASVRASDRWYGSIKADDIADRLMESFEGEEGASRLLHLHSVYVVDPVTTQRMMDKRALAIAKELDWEARQEGIQGQYTYQEIDVWNLLEAGYLLPLEDQGKQPANKKDYRNPDSVSYSDKADLNKAFNRLDSKSRWEIHRLYVFPRKTRVNKEILSEAVKRLTFYMNNL